MAIYKDLKRAIVAWLMDNEHEFQRANACHDAFRQYIYDAEGNFIIGGKETSDFITEADNLIYGR